ncbi:MAG: alpha/beta hydrolase [Rubrivivax sp.]|nr:alpha/beta hydrolase [Rubrivivax sp.]
MTVARVNGVAINHLVLDDEGVGGVADRRETLVMVHGLATNLAFWYLQHAPAFSRQFRVVLYDLRGHGRSEMPASGYRPATLAQDLAALLDHLGVGRCHMLAHSFGGVVAMNLAAQQPDRVQSLVLCDTHIAAVRHVETPQEWAYGREMQPILDRHGLELDTRDPYFGYRLLTRVARMTTEGFSVPAELRELVSPLMGRQGQRTAAQWLQLMQTTTAEAEMMGDDGLALETLRRFGFPILAMYGDHSQARLTGAELLDVWPHAEFRRVRDAGHFFPVSRPDEVISGCRRFWRGEFSAQPAQRAGEPSRRHFRSDRIFEEQGSWFFTSRELGRVGPFATADAARDSLDRFMATRLVA